MTTMLAISDPSTGHETRTLKDNKGAGAGEGDRYRYRARGESQSEGDP